MFNDEDPEIRISAVHIIEKLNRKWDLTFNDDTVESLNLILADKDDKARRIAHRLIG